MKKIKFLIWVLILQSCSGQIKKVNGVSFVASRERINQNHVNPIVNLNANYAAVMPFGFLKEVSNPNIIYNTQRQWFGETEQGAKQYIKELKKQKIKIMLKPQIWVWRGAFTGLIKMNNENDWKTLETSYLEFVLKYAKLAQELKVDIFCIGTELETFINNRPAYWKNLIKEVRNVYKGKLTYAANWDEYKRTPFWAYLDFIGIDAYFPISENKTPSVEDCLEGWQTHFYEIKENHEKFNKPVLFTEFGYRSVDYTAKEPWESDRSMNQVNLKAQANATKALFEVFWKQDWFAGGFVWKWFHNHERAGGIDNTRFTPQNKPAQAVISNQFNMDY